MIDVAFVTAVKLPEPDPDEPLLLAECARQGLNVACWAWDDPAVDWSACRLAVIRSTWNYLARHAEAVAWAEATEQRTRLMNPASVIAWNTDKAYLGALAARGVDVVPTVYVNRGEDRDLGALMAERGWDRVVVKPRISAGSFETRPFARADLRGGELAAAAAGRDVMVQPFVKSVDGHGERALVFIERELSHAIRKNPRFHGDNERVSAPVPASPAEVWFARGVLAQVDEPLLYARVDIAPDESGKPILMELEVTEPSLFWFQNDHGLARFVDACRRRSAA